MFGPNFTFGAAAPSSTSSSPGSNSPSSDYTTLAYERCVSPCSPVTAYPPTPYSVTDLAAQFANQRIHRESQILYDPCASYANTTDSDADWAIPALSSDEDDVDVDEIAPLPLRSRASTFPPPPSSSSSSSASATPHYSTARRAARQRSTRLLCTSSTHRRDLAELVSRMVSSRSQCSMAPRPRSGAVSLSAGSGASMLDSPPSPGSDEGYASGCGGLSVSRYGRGSGRDSSSSLSLPAAGVTGACVRKSAARAGRRRHVV